MATRPSMHARDSSGRKVSLLNDEPLQSRNSSQFSSHSHQSQSSCAGTDMNRSASSFSAPSSSGSPAIPALIRADSFDSQNTSDAMSPITPHSELGRQHSYMNAASKYEDQSHFDYQERMPSYPDFSVPHYGVAAKSPFEDRSPRSQMQVYEEDLYHDENGNVSERASKRFNCRYRDTLGCDKTFTTSGHASRHSKIHTAEKAVPCTFKGCQKKFTRNDNMKQHLETHFKDRARASHSNKTGSKPPALTIHSGVKKSGRATSRPQTPARTTSNTGMTSIIDPALFSPIDRHHPAFSSQPYNTLITQTLVSRPVPDMANQSPTSSSSGLDALAAAVDLQSHPSR
ncbi:C2H2 and C2HC zinc finger [Glarea lozoyensis ATCC 20868]|uniref:C2H2 type master regulator of conidiophore development brlA n=2 Tax=Glarea lozoyensis TaxID=101852 RepID=S3DAQ1_GLAL2|nr:C2H2 and C2HC zinc finger [Glarea lozoyensis ATCC 20868]EHK96319.1 putative transcriptional regulator NRG1 [Glarea lozoyensis 74030]EPE35547.1 C2H2 and C2HC zinc finger [Glarea lozoyensis ATCC 20868]